MKKLALFVAGLIIVAAVQAQVINICTNPAAQQVMLGMYNPATYAASTVINDPMLISQGINAEISPDSLHAYIDKLASFQNRNSGSDTGSSTKGIGAARRWVYSKFQQFSAAHENRLLPAYLQFDTVMCSTGQHRNIMAVLPGTDTTDKSIIIIEAHIDSRCEGLCDTACQAQGSEDNGSGSALVMELARVMSKYSFNHTIVFTLVIGEEQGLLGGQALGIFCRDKGIKIKAVLNNDVVGGVICGHTSSPPSCPGFMDVDSTHVRLFSSGGTNSPHKGLCRYIKLEYKEMIQPIAAVPMGLNIMASEDRTGRGGDHIPFRQLGYTAMRFTCQNENGDANVTSGTYTDRQHTSRDSIGVDANLDGVVDTYFVDFRYLARNAVINGNAAGMCAISPVTPDLTVATTGGNIIVTIADPLAYMHYRVGVRTTSNDWDSVYTCTGTTSYTITNLPTANYFISVASVDSKGVESLFSREVIRAVVGINDVPAPAHAVDLLQNKPNPADETTIISVLVNDLISYKQAFISIADLNGRHIKNIPITLIKGINEITYDHGYNMTGTYIYTLVVDGKPLQSKRMVFAN